MTICDLVRNTSFPLPLSYSEPFIVEGCIHIYEWDSTAIDIFGARDTLTQDRVNVKRVIQDYLRSYYEVSSIAALRATPSTFYFDHTTQKITIHLDHTRPLYTHALEYGYSYGMAKGRLLYINDYEYLPLIKSIPSIEQSADPIDATEPTYISGKIVLENHEHINPVTKAREGMLDFLIYEPVFGNDLFISDYNLETAVVTTLACLTIEKVSIGVDEVSLDLQDKRVSDDADVLTETLELADWPYLADQYVGKYVPMVFGNISDIELIPLNSLQDEDNPSINAVYRLPKMTDVISVGNIYVEEEPGIWVQATGGVFGYDSDGYYEKITITNGRDSSGSTRKAKANEIWGPTSPASNSPGDAIKLLFDIVSGKQFNATNYNTTEYTTETTAYGVDCNIGIYIDDQITLKDLVFEISSKSAMIFRCEYGPDGRITAMARDRNRTPTRSFNSVDIRNSRSLEVGTDPTGVCATAIIKYNHKYYSGTYTIAKNDDYYDEVLSKYRRAQTIEIESYINLVYLFSTEAQYRADQLALEMSEPVRIVKLEIWGNLDMRIYETFTATLQPDDLDPASREFFGSCTCMVLGVNPDPDIGINYVTAQIL